ncbi:hypothetical protein [Actinomyces urogenitalis]|jgi:hypothetical protein|uniref:hypothetical protein n=1 Tax=Actinomyces urogenitalis TaxID=103621 RepID=UPI00189B4B67|nr:hypothetical protein [Actinomyces urogenitalis]MDK8236773.1 hypothetical protein [Actinomyces urogenitalis]WOO94838.1 hypothetical protein R3I39_09155 [Actinomyces urogenitalis]
MDRTRFILIAGAAFTGAAAAHNAATGITWYGWTMAALFLIDLAGLVAHEIIRHRERVAGAHG